MGISITFLMAHLVFWYLDSEQLERFVSSASQTSQQLHSNLVTIFTHSNNTCSEQNLITMREDLWRAPLIKDVVHIQDGRIICSASWGNLEAGLVLPKPTIVWPERGLQHWRAVKDPIKGDIQVNMVSDGAVAVLIVPNNAYASIPSNYLNTGFILSTEDNRYVFHASGPMAPENVLTQSGSSWRLLLTQQCNTSSKALECVTAYNAAPGLFGKGLWFISVVGVLSLAISALLHSSILFVIHQKKSLKRALRRAIATQEISVLFQPKVCLTSGRIIGIETLARWHDKHFGHISPDIFVAIAEKNGLMPQLSRLVIEKALYQASSLLKTDSNLHLSINLSMSDMSDPSLLSFINDHCSGHRIPAHQLIFEITENSASGFEGIESSVARFTSCGYQISLDDFGTGYANLSWLSKIKATEIKVDRSFTQMIGDQDPYNRNTLSAIFQLLKDLNISTVFEGIETQEQAEYILGHIPHAIGQGWLFAKAMPIQEVARFINTPNSSIQHNADAAR